MLYLFLTDFVGDIITHITFDSTSGPVSCESIGILDDADFEGIENFAARAVVSLGTLTVSTVPAFVTITDRNGKYTSCPASQLVRNTCNIGI